MITIERRLPVNDAGDAAGPACPDGRLLALKCLGILQVATGRRPRRGSRNRSASLPPYDALAPWERPRQGRVARSHAAAR
jgi:hypothetical protein